MHVQLVVLFPALMGEIFVFINVLSRVNGYMSGGYACGNLRLYCMGENLFRKICHAKGWVEDFQLCSKLEYASGAVSWPQIARWLLHYLAQYAFTALNFSSVHDPLPNRVSGVHSR